MNQNLRDCASSILSHDYSAYDCRGLAQADAAETIAVFHFVKENIDFTGWHVSEIPLTDNSGEYPVAIVICLENEKKRIGISLDITENGELYGVCPDQYAEIELNTIQEAINHPTAKY